jgi:excisionase family DNA binding protein
LDGLAVQSGAENLPMAVVPIQPHAFTVANAVVYSGLCRTRLYTLMQTGELPSIRVGGRRMIRREAIDAYFDHLSRAEAA